MGSLEIETKSPLASIPLYKLSQRLHYTVLIRMPDSKDYMTNYLKRINDLESPLPLDSKLFLPERLVSRAGPEYQRTEVKLSGPRTKEENEKLRSEYQKCVAAPATTKLDTFPHHTVTEVLDGKGWIVPQLLSQEECEEV